MARKSKELDPTNQALEMNMTPMIDCVFLLLVFFMIVSEMSSLDLENMALAYADQAKAPEEESVDRRVVVNIQKDDAK
jgi:biopolymer transport protein ExbD